MTERGNSGSRTARLAFALALSVAFLAPAATPVRAETDLPGVSNFFRKLFGVRKKEQAASPRKTIRKTTRPAKKTSVRRKVSSSAGSSAASVDSPSEPGPEAIPDKLENARKVLVVGDFLAGGMADGLSIAFERLPGIVVVDRSNGSSGFVRNDFYDWPGEVGAMIDAENPAAVVVMIGSNDRQPMRLPDGALAPRSKPWDDEYRNRVQAFAKIVNERKVPLVWIGLPPFQKSTLSADMLAFNDVYRQVATTSGGEFVDIWDGFADENGVFTTTGPDINGQPARLRSGDGINVTKAGRRKIAFYAEKPLKKLLGGAASPDIAKLDPENLPGFTIGPAVSVPKIDRTPPMAINDPALDGGDELMGKVVLPAAAVRSSGAAEPSGAPGEPSAARFGRIDDFKVNPSPPAPGKVGGSESAPAKP